MKMDHYIHFITKKEQIWADIPARHQLILKIIYRNTTKIKHQVNELLALKENGSQATIHAAIFKLVSEKYLKLIPSKLDARVKFVALTTKGAALFAQLERLTQGNN